ncbi:MAG: hypothetical protein A2Z18_11180 [Armatimonadetes bacterium RBG_16_58_9]|nr:MAG: hypothetical protein A2Z18_11180 [Armatimonadetes bacterium RBG_16_58_9]
MHKREYRPVLGQLSPDSGSVFPNQHRVGQHHRKHTARLDKPLLDYLRKEHQIQVGLTDVARRRRAGQTVLGSDIGRVSNYRVETVVASRMGRVAERELPTKTLGVRRQSIGTYQMSVDVIADSVGESRRRPNVETRYASRNRIHVDPEDAARGKVLPQVVAGFRDDRTGGTGQ